MPSVLLPLLRVAIVGGGPGGLSAAIAISKLPNVEVTIYEQARELREIGAGIQIGFNCWKVLELLGAADDVKGHVQETILHRNGCTGEVLSERTSAALEPRYRSQRVRRTRLQASLIAKVPEGVIKLRKRLVSLTDLDTRGTRLIFEDGEEVVADLVIGGDGIRSIVRQSVFPDHAIQFTGNVFVLSDAATINFAQSRQNDLETWWHGPAGHFYNCLVDDPSETPADQQMFEIAVHNVVPAGTVKEKRFSWGIPASNERVESHFTDYDPRVQDALSRVPQGLWKEFSSFTGPRLTKVIAWDKVVLIGDASHPLTGAFGSGAAFAMQDGWILAQAIEHTRSSSQPLASALAIFDSIRSPYYHRMFVDAVSFLTLMDTQLTFLGVCSRYEYLDQQAKNIQDSKAKNPEQTFEESLEVKVKGFGGGDMSWIYQNDIKEVWEEFVRAEQSV